MLARRESQLVFKRKKNRNSRHTPLIIALFAGGILLIIFAFANRNSDDAPPNVPTERFIAQQEKSEQNALDPLPLAPPENALQQPLQPPQPQTAAPLALAPAPAPTPAPAAQTSANTALRDFLNLPVAKGATPPQQPKFAIVLAELTYDKNASPEDILRARSATYIVRPGDILGRIAQKNGCTIEQLKKANRLTNHDQIKIGQKLLIPPCKDDPAALDQMPPLVQPDEISSPSAEASLPTRGKWWKRVGVNTDVLPKLLAEQGFKPPRKFMAFVLELTFDSSRQVITRERAFDYKGTSSTNTGWNPASTVKIFAAIAALRRIDELGFTSRAKVTFHSKKTYSTTVGKLIEDAIIQSDNIAYDRVVQLASFEKLHKEILTAQFGITQTALNRAYQMTQWKSLGENPSLRFSPDITLQEGKKSLKIPAANSNAPSVCSSAACTSLQDLAESTRRLMLQEQLPPNESFNLKQADLLVLRRAMRSSDRTRGTEIVDRFAQVFKDSRVKFYSKPGFSEDWYTDNVYIFDPRYNQAWIVVMSGYPGRNALNSAATAIAKIISSGKLREIP